MPFFLFIVLDDNRFVEIEELVEIGDTEVGIGAEVAWFESLKYNIT